MKKRILTFLCCFFTAALCADLSISLELADIHYLKDKKGSVTPTAFEGDSFEVKVVVSGAQQAPDDVEIEGLDNFIRQGKSTSSNVSINNASILAERTTTYMVLPKETGAFTIGPATVRYKGKTYTSNKATLHVASQKERQAVKFRQKPPSRRSPSGQKQEGAAAAQTELFCKLKADRRSAVTEEPVLVTLSIFHRGNIGRIQPVPPEFANCSVKQIEKASQSTQTIKEKEYTVNEVKYLVFPQQAGTLKIPPTQVLYTIPIRRERKRGLGFFDDSFFADFFGGRMQQKSAGTNGLSLKVTAPPATTKRVDGIGTFRSFTAKIDKTDVNTNEPMKFALELVGDANFDLIEAPKLSLPPGFKKYDSQTKTVQDLQLNYTQGKKLFEFILQVPRAGTWTIPQQSFYYFNTQTKKYETLTTQPITITVTLPENAQSVAQPTAPDDKTSKPQTFASDIHFIEEGVPATKEQSRSLPLPLLMLLLLLVPMLFYAKPLLLTFKPIYTKIPFFSGKKNILGVYQKKLASTIEHNQLDTLYSLFTSFFAKSIGQPPGAVSEDVMMYELQARGLEKEKVEKFLTFLNECAQYSFAAGDQLSSLNLEDVEKRANYWFLLLHQTLKNRGRR